MLTPHGRRIRISTKHKKGRVEDEADEMGTEELICVSADIALDIRGTGADRQLRGHTGMECVDDRRRRTGRRANAGAIIQSAVPKASFSICCSWSNVSTGAIGTTASWCSPHCPRRWAGRRARLDAGEVFHPDYLARIRKAGPVRAMDWGRMNLDDGWSGPGPL